MMVETILESSQDFGMSNGTLPQWKRELLQRRAARPRPPPPAPPAPPPPPAAPAPPAPPAGGDEDEELRYGPGIVKRLKSRYLSLALRDAPRRRPSVLRRAASLEHLLDPPPAPRPPPPAPAPPRRDYVKRARSVDALARLAAEPPAAPAPRAPRPPRRPQPLLRAAERPPPDVVRAALRRFETSGPRRAPPTAPRRATPEPETSPAPPARRDDAARPVSRAALDGIARAGSSVRYAFPASTTAPGHLPPLPAPVARAPRRVGVIRPMPAPPLDRSAPAEPPPALADVDARDRRASPPSALVEPTPRAPAAPPPPRSPLPRDRTPEPACVASPPVKPELSPKPALLCSKPDLPLKPEVQSNTELLPKPDLIGPESIFDFAPKPDPALTSDPASKIDLAPKIDIAPKIDTAPKIDIAPKTEIAPKIDLAPKIEMTPLTEASPPKDSAKIEPTLKTPPTKLARTCETKPLTNGHAESDKPAWQAGRARRGAGGPAPGGATSVVFNFVSRREVPDYVENDGVVLRAARRAAFKARDAGVIVLENGCGAGGGAGAGSPDEEEEVDGRATPPPPPRFVNDNVLINGRSSMPARPNKDRITRLKLQFDDSLTRTHEYPSEESFCEDAPADAAAPAAAAPAPPPAQHQPHLAQNTHMSSAALCGYLPSKTPRDAFQLGVTRPAPPAAAAAAPPDEAEPTPECGDVTRWADARSLPDLLF